LDFACLYLLLQSATCEAGRRSRCVRCWRGSTKRGVDSPSTSSRRISRLLTPPTHAPYTHSAGNAHFPALLVCELPNYFPLTPTAEPPRHQHPPKHPRPSRTKTPLYPRTIPTPRTTRRTRRQIRQPIPHILRTLAPKHHQRTPQPIPKNASPAIIVCNPARADKTMPTHAPDAPQRTKGALRVGAHRWVYTIECFRDATSGC